MRDYIKNENICSPPPHITGETTQNKIRPKSLRPEIIILARGSSLLCPTEIKTKYAHLAHMMWSVWTS